MKSVKIASVEAILTAEGLEQIFMFGKKKTPHKQAFYAFRNGHSDAEMYEMIEF